MATSTESQETGSKAGQGKQDAYVWSDYTATPKGDGCVRCRLCWQYLMNPDEYLQHLFDEHLPKLMAHMEVKKVTPELAKVQWAAEIEAGTRISNDERKARELKEGEEPEEGEDAGEELVKEELEDKDEEEEDEQQDP